MPTAPVVSAVIIFLNEVDYLTEAIESVIAQSNRDWELLLVDDGSTDGSSEIGQSYAARDPGRIRYLTHPRAENRGMSASRNLGLREAAGEYVAYLDGDDVWLPTKLEQQLAILEERAEVDAVYGPLRRWRRWADSGAEDDVYGFGLDSHHPYADSVVEPPTLVALFLDDEFYIPGGLLIRREAALNVGGFEEEFGGMYEDAVFLVKLLLQSSAFVSSQSSYLYRLHDASCNHVAWLRGEERAAELHYLEWVESYLTSTGTNAPELRRSLRRASFRVRHPVLDGLRTPGQVLRVALTRGRSVAGRARSALAHASNPRRAT